MKNYICTGKGFVKSSGFDVEKQVDFIEYTDKVRYAQPFKTKAALKWLEFKNIEGFVWKPYEQEAIHDMYSVVQRREFGFGVDEDDDNKVMEWFPEKAMMEHESDNNFLLAKTLKRDKLMTFDEAKAKALELNTAMLNELTRKLSNLNESIEPEKGMNIWNSQ